jgi:ATP-dependent DNA helicase RecQ
MKERKELEIARMKAMVNFVTQSHQCRMSYIQDYFGETTNNTCNICDVCVARRKKENLHETEGLRKEVLLLLSNRVMSVEQLEEYIAPKDRELFIEVIREMVDGGEITYDDVWRLRRATIN